MPNVRDVLRELGVPFKEHGTSPLVTDGWVGLVCPYCDGGKNKPGLGVHIRTLKTSCWRCGGHSLAAALSAISGVPAGKIRALLGDLPPERIPDAAPPGKLVLPPGIGPLLPAHRKYLTGRRFDPDVLEVTWGIKGIGPVGGPLQWRVFIPVLCPKGKVVSWTTRAIGNVPHGHRYRGASREQSAIPRGELLYGEHLARHAVIVVEGPTDVWAIGPGAVCTCGVGFSKAQVLRISKYPVRVIIFDNERRAQQRASKLAEMLAGFAGETHIVQMSGADPATSPPEEIEELRRTFLE